MPGARSYCDQGHIAAQARHVGAPVVEDEEETAGKRRRPGFGAEQGVQLVGPQLDLGAAESVEVGGRGGHDVADALVGGGGQQARLREQRGELRPALLREAAQLRVPPEVRLIRPSPRVSAATASAST
ncbi:hypothetical protein SNARM312S_01843 [Streptomyces narbonensis]